MWGNTDCGFHCISQLMVKLIEAVVFQWYINWNMSCMQLDYGTDIYFSFQIKHTSLLKIFSMADQYLNTFLIMNRLRVRDYLKFHYDCFFETAKSWWFPLICVIIIIFLKFKIDILCIISVLCLKMFCGFSKTYLHLDSIMSTFM